MIADTLDHPGDQIVVVSRFDCAHDSSLRTRLPARDKD